MAAIPVKNRAGRDIMKLMENKYEVVVGHAPHHYNVKFLGPKDTPYENGIWAVRVHLPSNYPYLPPVVGFFNRIFHPNVDPLTGAVCIDVLRQTWTPLYDLCNVFDSFLPQLLTYPNADDPLSAEAAKMLLTEPELYRQRVAEWVKSFACFDFMTFEADLRKQIESSSENRLPEENSDLSLSDYEHDEGQPDQCVDDDETGTAGNDDNKNDDGKSSEGLHDNDDVVDVDETGNDECKNEA